QSMRWLESLRVRRRRITGGFLHDFLRTEAAHVFARCQNKVGIQANSLHALRCKYKTLYRSGRAVSGADRKKASAMLLRASFRQVSRAFPIGCCMAACSGR